MSYVSGSLLIIHSCAVVVMLHKVKLIYDVASICRLYDGLKALGDAEECEKKDRMNGKPETRSRSGMRSVGGALLQLKCFTFICLLP